MTAQTKSVTRYEKEKSVKRNEIRCALNLTEDFLDKILSVSPSVKKGECSSNGNEITYGGTISFNVIFASEETSRAEVGAKFTFKSVQEGEAYSCTAKYFVEDLAVKNDGGMLYAVCDLVTELTVARELTVEYVSEADALCKKSVFENAVETPFKKIFTLDDEFSSKRIKRALYSDACAIVSAVSAEDDVVTVDGEAVLSVCLLPFSENGDIIKETRVIPFRYEIECSVKADALCFAEAKVEKVSLKIYVDEESGTSTVSSEIDVAIFGCASEKCEEEFVSDVCSVEKELKLSKEVVEKAVASSFDTGSKKIIAKAVCKIPEYSRLIKIVGERIENYSVEKNGDNLVIGGLIVGDALFADGDDKLFSSPFELPFEIGDTAFGKVFDADVIIESASAKMRSGELECDVSLRYSFAVYSASVFEAVTSIEEAGDKASVDSAISVYVGRAGDELWDAVKALGVDGEKICESNEVSFPLKGGEKLVVFREL